MTIDAGGSFNWQGINNAGSPLTAGTATVEMDSGSWIAFNQQRAVVDGRNARPRLHQQRAQPVGPDDAQRIVDQRAQRFAQASYSPETDATINIESGASATFSQMSTDYNGFNNPIVTINLDGGLSLTNFNQSTR